MTDFVHPGLLFILGAIPIPFLKGSVRKAYVLLIPTLAILAVLTMHPGGYGAARFIGQEIIMAKVDKLSILFATVFSIMALIGTVYAWHL
ncbi:MAG: Na+/H+ antiporter subunit D, partial [Mesorhizobium sp.]